jgi:hypothetical protein
VSIGWSGPDPVGFADGGSANYELGTGYTANGDVTINKVRVWGPPGGTSRLNREGKIWSSGGSLLGQAAFPNVVPSGWTSYDLVAPVEITSGTSFVVSYDVTNSYGANISPAYPRISADTLLTATTGRRDLATPDIFPTGLTAGAFYGVDVDYVAGIAGNVAPQVTGLAVAVSGLNATATWTVTDETPGTVTYKVEWGDGTFSNTSSLTASHTYASPGLYAVLVTATDNAGAQDAAAFPIRLVTASSRELAVNRKNTKAFIDARPSTLALIPTTVVRTEAGGKRASDGPPRVAQVLRVIEQASAYGNSPGLLPTQDGQQRRVTYQLLGEFDAVMAVGDHWLDADGIRYEVRELLPYNGYERRARVVQYG